MTTQSLRSWSTPGTAAPARGTQVRVLTRAAMLEAWRLIRHPVHLAGWLLLTWALWPGNAPEKVDWGRDQFSTLPLTITMFIGVPTFAAASLLATRPRRAEADDWLSSLPTGQEARWAISLLAAIGPFTLSVVPAAALWYFVRTNDPGIAPRPATVWEYAVGPVCVLGAGLLAVLLARWLPWPLIPAVVMTSIIAMAVAAQGHQATWFSPYADHARWADLYDNVDLRIPYPGFYAGFLPGSMPWHVTYLVGLDLLAVVGVFVMGRYRWYAAAAALPLLALVGTAGAQQLA